MKTRIVLLDESLTVQKVIALTLNREQFSISNVKTRSEAMKLVLESPPALIIVSDQVQGINASAFPKEVETWVGRDRTLPAMLLITNQDIKDMRGYGAVLKKPFAPSALQAAVDRCVPIAATPLTLDEEGEDLGMQRRFVEAFSDEASLVAETLAKPAPKSDEQKRETVQVLGPEDSMAYKAQLEQEVGRQVESYDLENVVHRLLEKMVPPIVERLAQERLDKLLKESESFVELKP